MQGERLTALIQFRKLRNKTQAQVAAEVGVSKATYGAWETGRNKIGAQHLIALSKCLGCSPNDILGYKTSAGPSPLPVDSEEQELVTLYRSLPPNIRNDILDIMRTTVKGWRLH